MNDNMVTDILPFDHEISHRKSSFASLTPSSEPRFPAHPMRGSDHSTWPGDVEFSIRVQTRDRQFPDVKHEADTVFFSSRRELEEYIEAKKDWVKGTDGDFQITYHVYRWDWGPQYESSGSI